MAADPNTASSAATVVQSVLTFLSGALTALFAEPVRQWLFRPNLELTFDNDGECVSRTFLTPTTYVRGAPTPPSPGAVYIRVRVNNKRGRMARECRGYLIGLEAWDAGAQKFINTEYCDSIMLHWSCQRDETKYLPLHIPRGVNQFLDVIALEENQKFFIPQLHVLPNRYQGILYRQGVFRFTIQVVADNVNPKTIDLIFEWNGDWKSFKVRRGP